MALKGNIKIYTLEVDENKTVTETIDLPENLPEDHPDYSLRGQRIQREFPQTIEYQTLYENVYVQIISYMFHKRVHTHPDMEDLKDECLDLHYRVYESEEARRNDFNDYILDEHVLGKQIEQNPGDDLRTLGYELLKQQRGFEEVEDAL
tara:strand:+ start:136 stop:582 length:447 start_codon:yes stop_codon:yes gene_type:complete